MIDCLRKSDIVHAVYFIFLITSIYVNIKLRHRCWILGDLEFKTVALAGGRKTPENESESIKNATYKTSIVLYSVNVIARANSEFQQPGVRAPRLGE